jgi:putative acetyltransferase
VCAAFYEIEQIDAWSSGKEASGYLEPIATRVFLVAVAEDLVVGFGELVAEAGEIRAVYVRPDRVRQRVGSALLAALEAEAHDRSVARLSLRSTVNAVPFYERYGYVSDGADVAVVRGGVRLPCVKMHKDCR